MDYLSNNVMSVTIMGFCDVGECLRLGVCITYCGVIRHDVCSEMVYSKCVCEI